jgi:hypothetical protein
MKFRQDQKVEFKNSFELYRQISLKVFFNFFNFSWTKVSKISLRVNLCSKAIFLPSIQIEETLNEMFKSV